MNKIKIFNGKYFYFLLIIFIASAFNYFSGFRGIFPIDSFLIWRLTKGKVHATDATNASRTMIYNISTNKWDDTILNILKIKKHILPEVKDCADDYGQTHPSITGKAISITGVVGDQQSECKTILLKSKIGEGRYSFWSQNFLFY